VISPHRFAAGSGRSLLVLPSFQAAPLPRIVGHRAWRSGSPASLHGAQASGQARLSGKVRLQPRWGRPAHPAVTANNSFKPKLLSQLGLTQALGVGAIDRQIAVADRHRESPQPAFDAMLRAAGPSVSPRSGKHHASGASLPGKRGAIGSGVPAHTLARDHGGFLAPGLAATVALARSALTVAPNNSFKPKPLRGSA
jgi:hypothetical protein